jgi:hypothetical protein
VRNQIDLHVVLGVTAGHHQGVLAIGGSVKTTLSSVKIQIKGGCADGSRSATQLRQNSDESQRHHTK